MDRVLYLQRKKTNKKQCLMVSQYDEKYLTLYSNLALTIMLYSSSAILWTNNHGILIHAYTDTLEHNKCWAINWIQSIYSAQNLNEITFNFSHAFFEPLGVLCNIVSLWNISTICQRPKTTLLLQEGGLEVHYNDNTFELQVDTNKAVCCTACPQYGLTNDITDK